jgi:hypothetical protein
MSTSEKQSLSPSVSNDCKTTLLKDLSAFFFGTHPLRQNTVKQEFTLAVGKSELVISDVSNSFLLALPWNSVVNYDCSQQYWQNEADKSSRSPLLTILLEVETDDISLKFGRDKSTHVSRLPQNGLLVLALTSTASKFACTGIWQDLEEKIGKNREESGIGLPFWARALIDKQCSWLIFPQLYKFLREDKNEKKLLAIVWVVGIVSALLSLSSSVRNLYLALPESQAVIDQAVHNLEILMESFGIYISIITGLLLKAAYIVEMFLFPFCKSLFTMLRPVLHVAKLTRTMIQPMGPFFVNIFTVLLNSVGSLSVILNLAKGTIINLLTHFESVSRASLAMCSAVAAFVSPFQRLLATCLATPVCRFAATARQVLLSSYLMFWPTLQGLARLVPRIPLTALISNVSKAPLAISRAVAAFMYLFGRLLATCLGTPSRQLVAFTYHVFFSSHHLLLSLLRALVRLVPRNLNIPLPLQFLLQAYRVVAALVFWLSRLGLCAASQLLLGSRSLVAHLIWSTLALLAQGASAAGGSTRAICRAGTTLAAWVVEICSVASSLAQDCAALSELVCCAGLHRVLEWFQDPSAAPADQALSKAANWAFLVGNRGGGGSVDEEQLRRSCEGAEHRHTLLPTPATPTSSSIHENFTKDGKYQ